MNKVIVAIALVCYIINYPLLTRLYPDVSKDYYVFIEFVNFRNIFFEFILFWTFLLAYRIGDKITKTISSIAVVLISSSLIDKVIFKIHDYLFTDIIIIVVSLLLAIKTYKENE